MKTQSRLAETPHLDEWLCHLTAAISEDGRRANLIERMDKENPRGERYWSNQLSAIIHKRKIPNAEVLLVIQNWIGGSE